MTSEETAVPFSYPRLIVGKRHLESPDFGNINNSDATGIDITFGQFMLYNSSFFVFGDRPGVTVETRLCPGDG
ncbi:MAG: hypothetical protein JGK30_07480 [Microcoleus sp. PH2017_40_RAT_O_B]|nr:hypothetical protein [Microcoleus sp. PH2017_34_RAT_O_A]MCC3609347.1 hypothetical protein [Microcoleus sp. PH2017_40_RAT_O_B]TAG01313.1 MAG: hypothetical protein EAZ45_13655 [Oscillatoriales cyanobacterium]TAG15722.1 MAG: hypothetical protein EAZ39_19830 [Oscillatoriales cyanobacterium]TAG36678.1 MAG: hypothetical protein EAZ33_23470 [Oscillatoriales cyanobacterium]TAG56783.1 MAG: hypothetical protein EAZ28_19055 [Oscillatoriales cyanobacterium]